MVPTPQHKVVVGKKLLIGCGGGFQQVSQQRYSPVRHWISTVHLALLDEAQQYGNIDELTTLARAPSQHIVPFFLFCVQLGLMRGSLFGFKIPYNCENPKTTQKERPYYVVSHLHGTEQQPTRNQPNPNHTKQFTTQANSTNSASSSVSSFLDTQGKCRDHLAFCFCLLL